MSEDTIIAKLNEYVEFKKRPSVFLKPKLIIHDNKWCVWYGESLDNGIAGYGKTPTEAFHDFDSKFYDSPPKSWAIINFGRRESLPCTIIPLDKSP